VSQRHVASEGVDPLQVDTASRRATDLICELAGGTYEPGVIRIGPVPAAHPPVTMRASRCNRLLGIDIPSKTMVGFLDRLGFVPQTSDDDTDTITCRPPSYRHDIHREVDLIEEVARLHGYEPIRVEPKIHIATLPLQHDVAARQAIRRVLTAHGLHETINPSLVYEHQGRIFLDTDDQKVLLDEQHRRPDAMLRPSLLPSLLACRKLNQDVGNQNPRLYEMACVWSSRGDQIDGRQSLALVIDARDSQQSQRVLRSAVEDLLGQLADSAEHDVSPTDRPGFAQAVSIRHRGNLIGHLGMIAPDAIQAFDLQTPIAAAELDVDALIAGFPPARTIRQLCRFPSIQRDLSLIVQDDVTWQSIEGLIKQARPDHLEQTLFIGTYRGKPIPNGQKSVSLRLEFRSPNGTLRHEEVDPQVRSLIGAFTKQLNAQLRS